MELFLALMLFIAAMAVALAQGITMIVPLLVGLALFTGLALKNGYSLRAVAGFAAESLKDSFLVIQVMLLIGCLTGVWRLSGTVAYFVAAGVRLIPPGFFLLAAFLLTAIMSFAIGTSFGVTATAGVILISIARAGSVNPVLAAGAVLSGVYVGDRGSPAASSANLVAVLTHTDIRLNVRAMMKSALVPLLVCGALYGLLSVLSPMQRLDTELLTQLEAEFPLAWPCLIPAALMIALPFCGLDVKKSMLCSLAAAFLVALFVEKRGAMEIVKAMFGGYQAQNEALDAMISGGGVVSMLEVSAILLISGTYGGIFRGTGLMNGVNHAIDRWGGKIGRFPAMLLLSAGVCAVFCNQTIAAIMVNQLTTTMYGASETEKHRKMLDMENSVILLAGLVPWCIACSVPLKMLGADARSLPLAFYLWLVPLWWLAVSSQLPSWRRDNDKL